MTAEDITTTTATGGTLAELLAQRAPIGDDAFAQLQRRAAADFSLLGFPTVENEEWRYTNVTPLAKAEFQLPSSDRRAATRRITLGGCIEIEVSNGRLVGAESSRTLAAGVTLLSGDEARRDIALLSRVGALVSSKQHPFAALNLALNDELLVLRVSAGTRFAQPIHIAYVTETQEASIAANVRFVLIAERASEVTLVETFSGSGAYFMNFVSEVFAEDGAIVDHYKVECESAEAWHIANQRVCLERNAAVKTAVFSVGGALVRNELAVSLDGEGADATLRGLYVLRGSQRVDNHTLIEHRKPNTNSVELYKGILDEKSHGIFDGKIVVEKPAQKTSSRQTNKNLLLSRDAVADSKPQLEIHADDVKCAHGSTIGQLDEEAVFYLRSRGISEDDARAVLSYAFASELLSDVRVDSLRRYLERQLLERIPRRKESGA